MSKFVQRFFIASLLCLSGSINAQTEPSIEVQIKTSKVLGLYEFTLGIAGKGYGSQTLAEIFSASQFYTPEAGKYLARLNSVTLSYDYKFSELVKHRYNSRQVSQLFTMAAAHSDDLEDFHQRTFGLIPNKAHDQLFSVLKYFMPIYDSVIWQPSQSFLNNNLGSLNEAAQKANLSGLFNKALNFYQSEWNPSTPFEIYILPIPSKSGHSLATPQGNVLSLSVLDGQDIEGQLSIIFHELSHILYVNQPVQLQQQLENRFLTMESVFKSHAYQLFDEAIATAVGNGWFLKQLKGQLDKEQWYYSSYIDQQAKSVYPIVEKYLEQGKSIDEQFVSQFVNQYAINFPKSHLEVENVLANTTILCEQGGCPEDKIAQVYFKHLQFLRSFQTLEPLESNEKQVELLNSISTQMIIVDRANDNQVNKVKNRLNWIKKLSLPKETDYVLANLNSDGVVQLVLVLSDSTDIETSVLALLKRKKLSGKPEIILI